MVSIKDIAKKAGMSPSTVSRVVNGKKYVNPDTRNQILRLIEETGYVPNKAARNMVMKRSFTVGIVIPDTFNIFQRQLFSIIERHLESFGYNTMFFFVKFDEPSEELCLRRMQSEKLDGVIILHDIKSPHFYDYLERIQLPAVLATVEYGDLPTVHINEEQAAVEAVNHLISLGHRNIGMINSGGFSFGRLRMKGFFSALRAAGIPVDERSVAFVKHFTAESGMYGMRELLLRRRDFTAVYAATDELAIGAIRVLTDEGIRVPRDVSVVGLDDIDISNYMVPRLTTIRQPLLEIGSRTALMLHRSINGDKGGESKVVLPYRLIIRESTARV